MCCATAAGTDAPIGRPAAARCRTSVEETGAVGAFTRKIAGAPDAWAVASCIRSARAGKGCPEARRRTARTRHRHEVAAVENRRVVLPRGDVPECVGPRNEEYRAHVLAASLEAIEQRRRVRRTRALPSRGRTRPAGGRPERQGPPSQIDARRRRGAPLDAAARTTAPASPGRAPSASAAARATSRCPR